MHFEIGRLKRPIKIVRQCDWSDYVEKFLGTSHLHLSNSISQGPPVTLVVSGLFWPFQYKKILIRALIGYSVRIHEIILENEWAPGSTGARNLSGANQRGHVLPPPLKLTYHKRWIFSHRMPAFNDPSRCQLVIGEIELRILALVKPHRTHPS